MIKRIVLLTLSLLIVFTACIGVSAYSHTDYIYDYDNQLKYSEASSLDIKLKRISEEYDCLVAVATTDYLYHYEAVNDAREVYEEQFSSVNENAIILLVCMNERKYGIYANGEAYDKILGAGEFDKLEEAIKPSLSDGDVGSAFDAFADKCDEILDDYHNVKVKPLWIAIALGIGIVIAFIVVLIMKAQLRSVRFQSSANSYLKRDSLNVTMARDIFLYSTITRTPKPQDKSSGSSSGGGRSGSF